MFGGIRSAGWRGGKGCGGLARAPGIPNSPALGAVRVSGPGGDDRNGEGRAYRGGPKRGGCLLASVQRWDKRAGEARERARRWQRGGGGRQRDCAAVTNLRNAFRRFVTAASGRG